MTRLNIWAWTIVGLLAFGDGAAAAEFQLDRDWVGRFNISATVFGGPNVVTRPVVPSLLESVLDDVADDYTLDSLVYAEGGADLNKSQLTTSFVTINPPDFPGQAVTKLLTESLTLTRVEWLEVPSYASVDPAALGYGGGDTWFAQPVAPAPLDPILLRLTGQYQGTLDGVTVTEDFDETIELDPGQLPRFSFSSGNNYPDTLRFGALPSFGQGNSVDIQLLVGGVERTIRLTGQFVHVPEPGTIVLTLIASGGLGLCRVWRRRTKSAA